MNVVSLTNMLQINFCCFFCSALIDETSKNSKYKSQGIMRRLFLRSNCGSFRKTRSFPQMSVTSFLV